MRDTRSLHAVTISMPVELQYQVALFHVHDSVIRSMDERKYLISLLIDLSTAFDTIDHAIL